MTKQEFLTKLEGFLRKIPKEERYEILRDYQEHFKLAEVNGETEKETVESLGSPKAIAKDLSADFYITYAKENRSISNISRAIFEYSALGLFNMCVTIPLIIIPFSIIFSLYLAAPCLIIFPILIWFKVFLNAGSDLVAGIFNIMIPISIGVLVIIGTTYFARWSYILILRYLQMNIQIVKRVRGE
ncbi:DUF1700 domain-containing protein [Viridibacillus sp. YIM B01967]|uniref:Membrane protein n=2 Tax=Caryophanaceae TaxID=186818 RepID=A0A927MLK7_9BACL|nr:MULTISPECIES: DUF1700 domain-containing protein [Planococcaceae]MBE1556955.1 putative membrane protein [Sporosarcina limicola]MBK3497145.1 DUF1700 domain-containing protein [Viridibacillus soli]